MKELITIGIARSDKEVDALVKRGQEWIDREQQRNTILDRLIEYYALHFASLQSMRSLEVLRTLFH